MKENRIKHTKTATGNVQISYAQPKIPFDVSIISILPYEALVTKIKIDYIKVPHAEAVAAWNQSAKDFKATCIKRKRHLAAVKANATRKARKAESEVQNA